MPTTSIVSPPVPVSANTVGRLPVAGSARRPWLSSTTTVSAAGANALVTTIWRAVATVATIPPSSGDAQAWPSTRIRPSPALAMTARGESICACTVAFATS